MTHTKAIQRIRNIGIIAHIDAGKTTTTERILFYSGQTHRLGAVDDGTTVTDWLEQERERGITIVAAAITTTWTDTITGDQAQINIIDTPGHIDFTAEVQRSLRVLDGGVVVFDAVNGVEPQSETVWRQANDFDVPRVCFVNKMDRPGADFDASVQMMVDQLGATPLPLQLPIGVAESFVGVVDLVEMHALLFSDDLGAHPEIVAIPADLLKAAEFARDLVVERICETDDDLTQKYLSGDTISNAELYAALRRAVIAARLFPVLCGSALRNKGVQPLLDAIVRYLPSPVEAPPIQGVDPADGSPTTRHPSGDDPLCALVFKIVADPFAGRLAYVRLYSGALKSGDAVFNATRQQTERVGRLLQMQAGKRTEIDHCQAGDIAAVIGLKQTFTGETLCDPSHQIVLEPIHFPEPVIRVAIEAQTNADQAQLLSALERLAEEDPTFKISRDEHSGQTLISGMGELHLEIVVERLKREFGVKCKVGAPQVAYRETITKAARGEGRYIRQSGGHGHYAVVTLEVEPNVSGAGFEFVDKTTGGDLAQEFVGAVEAGVRGVLGSGALAGYQIVDVNVALLDGKLHEVDSHPDDFEVAGSMAFKEACRLAGPIFLEPAMRVETTTPEEYLGSVVNDIAKRRGAVNNLRISGDLIRVVQATVPLNEMIGYATDLRSLTSGRGAFTMQLDHYAPAPPEVNERILGPMWRRFIA